MYLHSIAPIVALTLGMCTEAGADQWSTSVVNSQLRFNYGTASNSPQYGVLDLPSSYLRMNYGPSSGWGTSIDTMPSYWSGGHLYQGFPVSASAAVSGSNLVLTVNGASNGMIIHETITVSPPHNGSITASVSASVSGTVALDGNRPGEAFKPVFLSSMHDSASSWDSSKWFAGTASGAFPSAGWILPPSPAVISNRFGLFGGTSAWKTNAPAVEIRLAKPMQIAGWLTQDSNPNDDNVGFWAASPTVLPSWSYSITVASKILLPPRPRPVATPPP